MTDTCGALDLCTFDDVFAGLRFRNVQAGGKPNETGVSCCGVSWIHVSVVLANRIYRQKTVSFNFPFLAFMHACMSHVCLYNIFVLLLSVIDLFFCVLRSGLQGDYLSVLNLAFYNLFFFGWFDFHSLHGLKRSRYQIYI